MASLSVQLLDSSDLWNTVATSEVLVELEDVVRRAGS